VTQTAAALLSGLDDKLARESSVPRQISLIETAFRPILAPESVDWVFLLAEVVHRRGLRIEVTRGATSALSWQARDVGQRFPGPDDWARCESAEAPAEAYRVLAYVHGQRLRFDFKFEELARQVRGWLDDVPEDPQLLSLAAFAALGMHSLNAEPLLRRAMATDGYDSGCRYICLQGLWFASHLDDQAERILELSDEMIGRGEDSPNLYYWRAFALRRLLRFDEATSCVDQAIATLPPGMNAVHQDYFRERELINTSRLLHEQVTELSEGVSRRLKTEFQGYFEQVKEDLDRQSSSSCCCAASCGSTAGSAPHCWRRSSSFACAATRGRPSGIDRKSRPASAKSGRSTAATWSPTS
jgi:tetratricopeptide (TPR) repeat protein